MKKRELGTSGLFVSELGFGAMSLPNNLSEANEIFDAALHAGINFFDTADLYDGGKNEEFIASLLKGRRNDIVLATKVGNKLNADGKSWSWNPTKKHITEAVKQSLRRLGTDYIDLYQLHGGTIEDHVDETIDAFESLKKEGLILQYGISSIRPTVIKRFLEKSSAISVMMQYSVLDRRPEEWFSMIEGLGASIITRGTIAKGFLTLDGTSKEKALKGFASYNKKELIETLEDLHKNFDDLHAVAIVFVLNEQSVSSALVGAKSKQQLLDSIIAYKKGSSIGTLEILRNMTTQHQYKEHRLE
ncbi:aldo/keto reductase [Sporosarcina ureilytica]|uniref:Oxidoreductase n=1 Tax=Sporosarcina ureilytica TaxID=298596 RepID=A0A1D8JHB6_9BACL|nr:aldo/keto reductase [Sporosarcina ureilytica]AOV08112.1 oxidoreductase [Sporosarcina ureilytica]